jgi:hypothetical protein
MRSPLPSQETDPPPRQLVPDAQVRAEFAISAMSLFRWRRDPLLDFPRPVVIRGRRYFWRDEIEAFKDRLIAEAASGVAKPYTPVRSFRGRAAKDHAGGAVT